MLPYGNTMEVRFSQIDEFMSDDTVENLSFLGHWEDFMLLYKKRLKPGVVKNENGFISKSRW